MNIITIALHVADAAVAFAKVSATRADDIKMYDEALTVIREALAEQEKQEPVTAMKKPNVPAIAADVHAALCFALWHHQGGSSSIGQPIREMLGLGQHDHMTSEQYFAAKRVAEALAEQEKQEPVAWRIGNEICVREDWACVIPHGSFVGKGRAIPDSWVPLLYAAPVSAKREWVELTDDEVDKLLDRAWDVRLPLPEFARTVITAFKKKNK